MAETLWDGGPVLASSPEVFPMGTDSILLSAFARPGNHDKILDLGTGSGILPILLTFDHPHRLATGIEISPAACALARENVKSNGISDRVQIVEGDLRSYRELLPAGAFDLTISNPPYFGSGSGPDASFGLKDARGDSTCSLPELCSAAAWSTRYGGTFCLVFRPERICDLFCALRESGFEPKRLRPVRHSAASGIILILVEAKRGGKPGVIWENDLCLRTPEGQETDEVKAIYRRIT